MKPFLGKLAILIPLLLLLQIVVGSFYPMGIPAEILQFQQHVEDEVDVLYFGDSTLWHPRGSQTTAQMVQEYFPERTVGEVSHAAYNLDLYLAYIQALVRYTANHAYQPEVVVIPINMHSFSPEWDQRPEYQFTTEKRILTQGITWTRLFGRPLSVFGGYDSPITSEEYFNTAIYSDTVVVGTVADFEQALGNSRLEEKENAGFVYYQTLPEEGSVENMLVYYYMTPLTADHRKVQSMLQIISLLQEAEIDLLFYITPVDTELGDVYLGESFRRRFTANKELLLGLLAEQNVPALDLSYALAPFYFSDSEHLQQDGKRYIAEQLVTYIDPSLPLDRNSNLTAAGDEVPANGTPTVTPLLSPVITATPSPMATIDAAENPLLATAAARATQAAGGNGEETPTPTAP